MEDNPDRSWWHGLPFVTYAINTSVSRITRKTPYEVVFGQHPKTNELHILQQQVLQN